MASTPDTPAERDAKARGLAEAVEQADADRISTAAAVEDERVITAAHVAAELRRFRLEQRILYAVNLALLIWLATRIA